MYIGLNFNGFALLFWILFAKSAEFDNNDTNTRYKILESRFSRRNIHLTEFLKSYIEPYDLNSNISRLQYDIIDNKIDKYREAVRLKADLTKIYKAFKDYKFINEYRQSVYDNWDALVCKMCAKYSYDDLTVEICKCITMMDRISRHVVACDILIKSMESNINMILEKIKQLVAMNKYLRNVRSKLKEINE